MGQASSELMTSALSSRAYGLPECLDKYTCSGYQAGAIL